MEPPRHIDGATVTEWAWSDVPFGFVGGEVGVAIHGLALCRYDGSYKIYLFACNSAWETQRDLDYASIEDAKTMLPMEYRHGRLNWHATLR